MNRISCREAGFDCDFEVKSEAEEGVIEFAREHAKLYTSWIFHYPMPNNISRMPESIIPGKNGQRVDESQGQE